MWRAIQTIYRQNGFMTAAVNIIDVNIAILQIALNWEDDRKKQVFDGIKNLWKKQNRKGRLNRSKRRELSSGRP